MNETRLWKLGSIIVIVALLAGTWFLAISPRLAEASQANEQRSNVQTQNVAHEAELAALEEKAEHLDEFNDELATLRLAIPSGAGLPLLIDQLNLLAAETQVTIKQLTASDPSVYTPLPASTESTELEGETDAQADPELASARASIPPESFLVIPIGLSISGTYSDAMNFVDGLQHGDRLILVHNLDLTTGPASGSAQVELEITAQTFVLLEKSSQPETSTAAGTSEAAAVVE